VPVDDTAAALVVAACVLEPLAALVTVVAPEASALLEAALGEPATVDPGACVDEVTTPVPVAPPQAARTPSAAACAAASRKNERREDWAMVTFLLWTLPKYDRRASGRGATAGV